MVFFTQTIRSDSMNNFGSRLENLREKTGYTKKEVSKLLGFSPNVYGSYEREERRPSYDTLIDLAKLFNVSTDYLLTGREYQAQASSTSPNLNRIKEVLNIFEEKGFDSPFIVQVEKWRKLSEEDLHTLTEHFNWVVYQAQKRA